MCQFDLSQMNDASTHSVWCQCSFIDVTLITVPNCPTYNKYYVYIKLTGEALRPTSIILTWWRCVASSGNWGMKHSLSGWELMKQLLPSSSTPISHNNGRHWNPVHQYSFFQYTCQQTCPSFTVFFLTYILACPVAAPLILSSHSLTHNLYSHSGPQMLCRWESERRRASDRKTRRGARPCQQVRWSSPGVETRRRARPCHREGRVQCAFINKHRVIFQCFVAKFFFVCVSWADRWWWWW